MIEAENGLDQRQFRSRWRLPASVAQRKRIVLMLAEGASYSEIKEKLDTTAPTISRWKKRYCEEALMGLATLHPGQPPSKLTRS
jgi:transposase